MAAVYKTLVIILFIALLVEFNLFSFEIDINRIFCLISYLFFFSFDFKVTHVMQNRQTAVVSVFFDVKGVILEPNSKPTLF